jgi:hypothetical protein
MWVHHGTKDTTLKDAIIEIQTGPDRSMAIVAGAFVEDHLTTVLKSRFHHDEKIVREMFNKSGPLASFGTKINLAFLTGLLSERACNDLRTILKIRNQFAHVLGVSTFEMQPVKDFALNLTIPDWYNVTFGITTSQNGDAIDINLIDDDLKKDLNKPRARYIASCRCFLAFFTIEQPSAPPTPRI